MVVDSNVDAKLGFGASLLRGTIELPKRPAGNRMHGDSIPAFLLLTLETIENSVTTTTRNLPGEKVTC